MTHKEGLQRLIISKWNSLYLFSCSKYKYFICHRIPTAMLRPWEEVPWMVGMMLQTSSFLPLVVLSVLEGDNSLKMWRWSVHGISFHSLSIRALSWICSQLLTHTSKWTPCISLVNINVTPMGSFWIRICTASLAMLISGLDYSVIEVTKRCVSYIQKLIQ